VRDSSTIKCTSPTAPEMSDFDKAVKKAERQVRMNPQPNYKLNSAYYVLDGYVREYKARATNGLRVLLTPSLVESMRTSSVGLILITPSMPELSNV